MLASLSLLLLAASSLTSANIAEAYAAAGEPKVRRATTALAAGACSTPPSILFTSYNSVPSPALNIVTFIESNPCAYLTGNLPSTQSAALSSYASAVASYYSANGQRIQSKQSEWNAWYTAVKDISSCRDQYAPLFLYATASLYSGITTGPGLCTLAGAGVATTAASVTASTSTSGTQSSAAMSSSASTASQTGTTASSAMGAQSASTSTASASTDGSSSTTSGLRSSTASGTAAAATPSGMATSDHVQSTFVFGGLFASLFAVIAAL